MVDRYSRQVRLAGVGEAGQAKLAGARVLIVGCGALGSVAAETLVRAGVGLREAGGVIRLVDRDVVEWSNLQRQGLYDERDAREGVPKAEAAARRLGEINSTTAVEAYVRDVDARGVEALAGYGGQGLPGRGVDLIMDGLDGFATRYGVNAVAVRHGVAYVYAGAVGTRGMVYPVLAPTGEGTSGWELAGVAGPDLVGVFGGRSRKCTRRRWRHVRQRECLGL